MNLFYKLAGVFAVVASLFFVAGCETTKTGGPTHRPPFGGALEFKKGELVIVMFAGVEQQIQPHEERIKEDGTITMSLIGAVKAEGRTPGQLAEEIRRRYIEGGYYRASLNITVRSPDRNFFVGGEVKGSNRYPWVEGMTVVKAVQNAGYFTDYAKRSEVTVTGQNGEQYTVNYDRALKNPSLDVPVYPGDSITVPRKW